MFQNYQDAIAICCWVGYPNLFFTFTCNHKWPKVYEFLKIYILKLEDMSDLIYQLFKTKLDDFIKEIKKGNIFTKVKQVFQS